MKKLCIYLLLLLYSANTFGRTILTTLPLYYAPYHYPLEKRFDYDKDWYVDILGGAYYRSADQAFSNSDGTHKVPFSTLIFGQSDFAVADIFADSNSGDAFPFNPFVEISTISPRFDYRERGAVFGICGGARFGCEEKWHAGARVKLPIREIEVKEVCGGTTGGNNLTGETLAQVYQQRQETFALNDSSNTVFAARLDFLTSLNRIAYNTTGGTTPMVIYSDPDNINDISIAAIDATGQQPSAGPLQSNQPPVAVIDNPPGAIPTSVRWGDVNSSIAGVVQADGSGLTHLERGRFADDVNYIPLSTNQVNQSQLFVVPTLNDSGPSTGQMTQGSRQIQNAINAAVQNIEESVDLFFEEAGINFCDGRTKGLGDLDLELYAGRDWGDCRPGYSDFTLGFRFPTSNVVCNCKDVLKQPLGDNGHFQMRVGTQMGWNATKWCKWRWDFFYAWVFKATEKIAGTFAGATVKNIGPCVPAKVSWGYLFANFDITFFASECCGFNIGYQVYHKSKDRIHFCQSTATDLGGRPDQPLDSCVAALLTDETQHKILAEFFLSTNYCELFIGYDYAVAGRNAPVDSDFYMGIKASF